MSLDFSRRSFLYGSAAAAAAGPKIRLGIIGTGPRGQYLMKELNKAGEVEWVALCDVYNVRRTQAVAIAGDSVQRFEDYTALLDRKDIDAVVIATPDHWHARIAVDACRAGKDVYIEKPMVHNPADGLAVVRAAREWGRIVQVGMQGRVMPHFRAGRRFVETGAVGKVGLIRTWYNGNPGYRQKAPAGMERLPDGLDWKRWLGPAQPVEWNPEIYFSPYKWLHYDGGMVMGIGIHVIDSAHHFLGLTAPSAAVAAGGIYQYDDRDTPDVINVALEYPQKVNVTFEAEIFTAATQPPEAGIELRGTGGILRINRYDRAAGYEFRAHPETPGATPPAPVRGPGGSIGALGLLVNWIECIRTRQRPIANEEQGYYSAMACYMGAEAYRTRSRVVWNRDWNLPV